MSQGVDQEDRIMQYGQLKAVKTPLANGAQEAKDGCQASQVAAAQQQPQIEVNDTFEMIEQKLN